MYREGGGVERGGNFMWVLVPRLLKIGAIYPRLTQRGEAVPTLPALSPLAVTARHGRAWERRGAERAPPARVVWCGGCFGVWCFGLNLRSWFRG